VLDRIRVSHRYLRVGMGEAMKSFSPLRFLELAKRGAALTEPFIFIESYLIMVLNLVGLKK